MTRDDVADNGRLQWRRECAVVALPDHVVDGRRAGLGQISKRVRRSVREHLVDVDRPESADIALVRLHAPVRIVRDAVREVAVARLSRHRTDHT